MRSSERPVGGFRKLVARATGTAITAMIRPAITAADR
jgi:hypothetical protein